MVKGEEAVTVNDIFLCIRPQLSDIDVLIGEGICVC